MRKKKKNKKTKKKKKKTKWIRRRLGFIWVYHKTISEKVVIGFSKCFFCFNNKIP